VGVPNISAVPTSLDFGNTYVGLSTDRTVLVRNTGSDLLTLSGATPGNSQYSLVGASFPVSLGQNGSVLLTVRFTPTSSWTPPAACPPPATVATTLALTSNDPDGPLAVPLTGVAVVPPELDAPASVRAALATTLGPTAIQRTKTLMLRNTGCSDLNWTASALSALPASIVGATQEGAKDDPGAPGTRGNGGPDAFGYKWIDSDDPLGPAFDWVDITAVGTPIPFSADDQNLGPFPLPFIFNFYGANFSSFRACSNGWISFSSTATTFTNTPFPSGGTTAPIDAIAPFWDDLTFSGLGDAYYYYDGQKVIISYVAVPRLGSGGPYTFQILLYPSGTIDFQYLDMKGTRLNEATVGIQNHTRDVGLQMVFNAPYVKDHLRVRISSQPGWLSVSPASGVIPAGGQAALSVGFNATGLADGDYTGQVRIASNDLDEPLTLIPADLHVGVIGATVDIDPNTLNKNTNGNWVKGLVELPPGHDPAVIRVASVLVQRTVPVDPAAPRAIGDDDHDGIEDATYKFSRAGVRAAVTPGNSVPVEMIGEEEDVTWFAGTDLIRVLSPTQIHPVTGSGISSLSPGSTVELAWQDYPGSTPDHYELWYSADAGQTWDLVAGAMTSRNYEWMVPAGQTQAGLLDLVAIDGQGPMGAWTSEPFVISSGVTGIDETLPTQFGLQLLGPNPTAGRTALELAMPERGSVDVRIHDARGRLVRRVAQGEYAPGRHPVAWDGRDESGATAASGIYFARMTVRGRSYVSRFALMR